MTTFGEMASFNHSNVLLVFSHFILLFNYRFTNFDFLEWKKNICWLCSMSDFVGLCFLDFLKYPWPAFLPFLKENSTPMMSCAQMGKYNSSNYKHSTQILDKFWLQHSHNKKFWCKLPYLLPEMHLFHECLSFEGDFMASNPCAAARTLGKSFISRKERRTCQLMMTELL